jgi:hypothetical protein
VRRFAAEAHALDAAELKDITPPKRYTLLLCLTHRDQVQARDDLVEMFCKRMARIQTRAQEALEQIRIQHRETTETLVATLADVLHAVEQQAMDQDSGDAELGRLVRQAVVGRGDVRELLAA